MATPPTELQGPSRWSEERLRHLRRPRPEQSAYGAFEVRTTPNLNYWLLVSTSDPDVSTRSTITGPGIPQYLAVWACLADSVP